MKLTLLILMLHCFASFATSEFDIYRKNLSVAPSNKELCFDMINQLDKQKNENLALGYLGAFTMIKANHQFNPINKLKSFNTGKKDLEKAIKTDPTDVELRFIRYAIQISIPSFLGYNNNKNEDKDMLQKNIRNSSPKLQADILKLLKVKETKI